MMIYNYHRIDTTNAGDMWSAPYQYFEFSNPLISVGILDENKQGYPLDGDVIVGGGGLLGNPDFEKQLYYISSNRKGKLIAWGIGHNMRPLKKRRLIRYTGWRKKSRIIKGKLMSWGVLPRPHPLKIDYSSLQNLMKLFDMHGLRDFGYGYNWVPCVSCMHPLIDKYRNVPAKHEVVVFEHSYFLEIDIENFPHFGNLYSNLEQILAFLSSGDTIITSSYHGAYWGILLGRKMVVVPWSTKFTGFRYPVSLCYDMINLPTCLKEAKATPEALEECRSKNMNYAEQVADLLGVEVIRKKSVELHSSAYV